MTTDPSSGRRMNGLDRTRVKARAMLRAPVGLTVRLIERASGDFKYPLAVCAIFREEAPFLDEWIAFHHGIGVRHFYLYNNFSSDHFRQVLANCPRTATASGGRVATAAGSLSSISMNSCSRRSQPTSGTYSSGTPICRGWRCGRSILAPAVMRRDLICR